MTKEKKFDLQERFIDYAVRIMNLSEKVPNTKINTALKLKIRKMGRLEEYLTSIQL